MKGPGDKMPILPDAAYAEARNLARFNRYAKNIKLGPAYTLESLEFAFNVNWGPALEAKLKERFEYTRDAEGNFVFTKDRDPQKPGKAQPPETS